MLPDNGDDLKQGFTVDRQPSLTYKLDFNAGRVSGMVDGREAMEQSILLALSTERFAYDIFSPNYGNELNALAGGSPPLLYAQIEQVIREALLVDDRVTGVSSFAFGRKRGVVTVGFTVSTIFGDIEKEVEVVA